MFAFIVNKYFKNKGKYVMCLLCQELDFLGGLNQKQSIYVMKRHLKSRHPNNRGKVVKFGNVTEFQKSEDTESSIEKTEKIVPEIIEEIIPEEVEVPEEENIRTKYPDKVYVVLKREQTSNEVNTPKEETDVKGTLFSEPFIRELILDFFQFF